MTDGPGARPGAQRPLRVAVVAEWYPSAADPVHGIWAHRQVVAVAGRGVEVQVLALRRPVPPLSLVRRLARVPPDVAALGRWAAGTRRALRPETRDGVAVHSVPWLGPPRPLTYGTWGWWMSPSLNAALDRLHAAWPFDVLHAHCLAPAGHAAARWMARAPAGDARPAFVVSGHGPDLFALPDGGPLSRRAVNDVLREADLALANSGWARERIAAIAAPGGAGVDVDVDVVHLGADLEAPADPAGLVERGAGGRLTVITVAHLQARKHHDVVLRALARLPEATRPDYVIVGDGECRAALEALVRELGLGDRVTFTGQLANDAAVRRVAAADVFAMVSDEEPLGVAYLEAMGAGVPAIGARDQGGPQDITAAGEGMLLVAPGDDRALAAMLGELHDDRDRLAALGRAARATVAEHFTWERCGRATVAAYGHALALAGRTR